MKNLDWKTVGSINLATWINQAICFAKDKNNNELVVKLNLYYREYKVYAYINVCFRETSDIGIQEVPIYSKIFNQADEAKQDIENNIKTILNNCGLSLYENY